ncbi:MAG TPA: hypothetical protein VER03_17380 [Bryobacteraceae bacterium]|nr:hypothetical protein [Bryobacteraceae bacterium]
MMSSSKQVRAEEYRDIRQVLQGLPQRAPAADLRTRLRVLASKESSRRRSRATWYKWAQTKLVDFRLFANNLMRPLAIPTAGGFVSALLLFGVLAPTLATPGAIPGGTDVPTVLYTEASVRSLTPFGFRDVAFLVEVTIDDEGRVIEYSIPSEYPVTPELYRSIGNNLLFTQFTPVRNFGQPVRSKFRISFQSSQIDVRG